MGQSQGLKPALGAGLWAGTSLWAEPSLEGWVVGGHPSCEGTKGRALIGCGSEGGARVSQPNAGQRLVQGAGDKDGPESGSRRLQGPDRRRQVGGGVWGSVGAVCIPRLYRFRGAGGRGEFLVS